MSNGWNCKHTNLATDLASAFKILGWNMFAGKIGNEMQLLMEEILHHLGCIKTM